MNSKESTSFRVYNKLIICQTTSKQSPLVRYSHPKTLKQPLKNYYTCSDEITMMKLLHIYYNNERTMRWIDIVCITFLISYLCYQWEGYSSVFLTFRPDISVRPTVNRRNNNTSVVISSQYIRKNRSSEVYSQYIWTNSSSGNSIHLLHRV